MSDADDILGIEDIPSETVVVPEWNNKTVVVRGMNGADAGAFSSTLVRVDEETGKVKEMNIKDFMPQLLVKSLYNEQGQRIFRDDQVEVLGKKSAAVLKRLSNIASRLSGLDADAAKSAAKNSAGTLPAALP